MERPSAATPNAWWGFQARVPQADGSSFDAGDITDTWRNDETVSRAHDPRDPTPFLPAKPDRIEWPTKHHSMFCS